MSDIEINVENTHKFKENYIEFKDLINTFYNEQDELTQVQKSKVTKILDKNVKIIPKIIYNQYSPELKVEFKLGNSKQMYKIKDLSIFYDNMQKEEVCQYGAKLEFLHTRESFNKDSLELLDFILKHAEIIKYVNNYSSNVYRTYGGMLNNSAIILNNSSLDELFNILNGKEIVFEKDYVPEEVKFVDKNPNIKFELEKVNEEEYKLISSIDTYNTYNIFEGKDYTYFLMDNKFYRCENSYNETTLKLLDVFKRNFTREIKFNKKQLSNFFTIVLPKVENDIILNTIDEEELEKYLPQKLIVKLFLEFNEKNYVVATIKFCYGKIEFNPLNEAPKIPRNALEEAKSLNMLRQTGFMLDKKNLKFVLSDNQRIYEFLSQDITEYIKKFEILATEEFKQKQIRQPKISNLGVKINNNLLSINLEGLNFDKSELSEILKQYNLKKKFYRLKDGTFLSLEDNEDIEFINNLIEGTEVNYKDITQNDIQLPIYRSLYLNKILEKINKTNINKSADYDNMVKTIDDKENIGEVKIPQQIKNVLRNYQKVGYKWLNTLENYGFSGILADDMGLGKTIQIIAIILNYINNEKTNKLPIMVVCPSSLALNWKNEIEKFTTDIKTLVMSGNAKNRKSQIESLKDYDVVVTSYDLLKRDIDIYKNIDYEFRYVIADEAQYIKNSNTQNAKAIKQVKSQIRYALTGTPIENSLSELWSIFDFLMPGYLFSYNKFKEKYENSIIKEENNETMQKLKMEIEPFILRRTKKQVLTELPDKTVTILNNEMQDEQQKIYLSFLSQARKELTQEIEENGIENSKIKILSLLTRLRQICCHPSIFMEDYKGQSSKLNQCIEIIEDAMQSGHKILLFSSYTSVFGLIEKELKKRNIEYFKLTGQTKVNNRLELVEEFNKNPNIKIFLISLKAGGTGLNLTGADMVIHYDPWWNISAENQATDRAYRIGQKNNVQVYKLITKNSIEEKIYELQEKKAKLIENVLDTRMSFINRLSKEDIMKLFE